MNSKLQWWEQLPIQLIPGTHIPESKILAHMPEELKPEWHAFIRGSQCLALEDGDNGIYPHDFFRFLKIRRRIDAQ